MLNHVSETIPETQRRDQIDGGVLVIRDVETLRLLSDPLRLRMLELMREGPKTAKELAAALQVSQTRLYYHLKLLESHGLIAIAETRLVSGIVEKRYRAIASRLSVDKALIGPSTQGSDALDMYTSIVFDEVRSEINRSIDAGLIDLERTDEDELRPRRLVLGRKWLRMTPAQVRKFSRRYAEFIGAFERANVDPDRAEPSDSDSEGQLYEWLIAFYPTLLTGDRDSHRASNDRP